MPSCIAIVCAQHSCYVGYCHVFYGCWCEKISRLDGAYKENRVDYNLLKLIHIVSSTILFGTGVGSAFYMFMANRSRDVASIHFAARHVVIADWVFTTPAVIVQLLTGLAMMHVVGFEFDMGWLFWGLVLYLFAGACWLPVVWMQIKMRDMARDAYENNTPLPNAYWKMSHLWVVLGSLAFPAVMVVFYLMVMKPF